MDPLLSFKVNTKIVERKLFSVKILSFTERTLIPSIVYSETFQYVRCVHQTITYTKTLIGKMIPASGGPRTLQTVQKPNIDTVVLKLHTSSKIQKSERYIKICCFLILFMFCLTVVLEWFPNPNKRKQKAESISIWRLDIDHYTMQTNLRYHGSIYLFPWKMDGFRVSPGIDYQTWSQKLYR